MKKSSGQTTILDFSRSVIENERVRGDLVVGHTIPLDTSAHRLEVVRALLSDGVPLNILSRENGLVRRLLEYRRGTLPLRTCSDLVPQIRDDEIKEVLRELSLADGYTFIYDGTPRIAEVLAVIICFVRKFDKRVQLRAISLKLLDKSIDGNKLAALLIEIIIHEMGLPPKSLRYV